MPTTHRFTAAQRLKTQAQFDAVYGAKAVKRAGPLRVHGLPRTAGGGAGGHRLGLSIGARVGHAVRRARVKRMLREAFRLLRHDLAGAYDLVVVANPHEPATLEQYQRWLTEAAEQLHRHWVKRAGPAAEG